MTTTAHAPAAALVTVTRGSRAVRVALTVALAGIAVNARGADLWNVYQSALRNDPTFAGAEANYRAAQESRPIARAAYLPAISATGQRQVEKSNGQVPLVFDPTTNSYIESNGRFRSYTTTYTAQLTQPIFDWTAWESIRQADAVVAQAQAQFVAAQQDLIVRTATAYFNVITARDTMAADHAATAAYRLELKQAEGRYQAGSGTVIDVENARAALDQSTAAEIAAHQQIINAEEDLRAITGEPVGALLEPGPDLPLRAPDPDNGGRWVDTALAQNPTLKAARAAADVASRNVAIKRSGHYPTLNLVLSHSYNHNDQYSAIQGIDVGQAQSLNGNTIMLQVRVPIYSGGAVRAAVTQAQRQYDSAEDQVRLARRQTEQKARTAYLGVLTGISQVNALRQSVQSNETSLRYMEAGMRAGTRTIVDVTLARQNLVAAQTAYAQSRAGYLTGLLLLKQAAGILGPEDLKQISVLLRASATERP